MKSINYIILHKVEIGFALIGVLSILISLGLFTGILNNKPTYLKFYISFLTGSVALLFYLVIFVFDKAGSEKSNKILNNTENIMGVLEGGDSYLNINIFQKHNKVSDPALFILANVESGNRNDGAKYPLKGTEILIKADEEVIFSTTRDFSISTPYNLLAYTPTTKKDYIIFSIYIIATNKNYLQYTIMKKHTDGYWYERRIMFDDLFKNLLRENYFRNGEFYPKELLDKYPSEKLIEETYLNDCKDPKIVEQRKLFEFKQPK